MKFEQQTLAILKNFSSINPSICFKEGQKLRTISPGKTILAQATATSGLPGTFAIYDLSKFMSVISLFENPSITATQTHLNIKDDRQTINYTFADLSTIIAPPDRTPVVADPEISFEMSADVLLRVQKAMAVLGLSEMSVTGDGHTIYVKAVDSKKPGNDSFAIEVGETGHNFNMIFKAENIKLMPATYQVDISSKGIASFKGDVVEYWIATEASSTFGG